jgi:hypothetical protein
MERDARNMQAEINTLRQQLDESNVRTSSVGSLAPVLVSSWHAGAGNAHLNAMVPRTSKGSIVFARRPPQWEVRAL